MSIDGSGSSAGMNYFWVGPGIVSGAQTPNPVVNAAGTYTLLVTNPNNACTATASVSVNANINLPLAVAAANNILSCAQTQVTLSGAGSSAGLDYAWSGPAIVNGGNTLTPLVQAAGIYVLTVSNPANGCSATASVTLNANTVAPDATVAAPNVLTCLLTQTTVNAQTGAGWNYAWNGPGIVSGANSPSPTVNTAGTYALTVTNTGNGCTATTTANVLENKVLPDIQIATPDTLDCNQVAINLQGNSATPGVLYAWTSTDGTISAGANTPTPVVATAGVYTLTVVNPANGCSNTAQTSVSAATALFPGVQVQAPDCDQTTGGIAFTGGAGPYLYSIDGGNNFEPDSLFAGLVAGAYVAVVQDANGCEDSTIVEIPAVFPLTISLPAAATGTGGQPLSLNPVLNLAPDQLSAIFWTPADRLSCADCLNPTVQAGAPLELVVTAISSTGCTDTARILLNWLEQSDYYLPNTFSPGAEGENGLFKLYANGIIDQFEMQIFDRWGSLLFLNKDPGAGWDGRARGRLQETGVYVYWIKFDMVDQAGKRTPKLLKGDVTLMR